MRTKLLLPLVAFAMLATALPASAQGPIDGTARMDLDRAFLTPEGIGWMGTLEISGSGDLDGTYDFSMEAPVGGPYPLAYEVVLHVDPGVETPDEVRASDIQRRGPRHQ